MDRHNNIYVYPESGEFLTWAHQVSVSDKAKAITVSDEDYQRLIAYDYIVALRNDLLEKLWKSL